MTESPRSTDRPARTLPARVDQNASRRPGHASKIITAGLSTSLVLGIVSYLGNAANAAEAAKQQAVPAVQAPTVSAPTTSGTTPVVATPKVIVVGVPNAPTPVAAVPQAVPVPQALPVPQAVPVPAVTSGTTKASG